LQSEIYSCLPNNCNFLSRVLFLTHDNADSLNGKSFLRQQSSIADVGLPSGLGCLSPAL